MTGAGRRGALLALLACAGCAPGDDHAAAPTWSTELPGRAAIVAWGDQGTAPPDDLRQAMESVAGLLDLRAWPSERAAVWLSPDSVTVGWKSLAALRTFRDALAARPGSAPVSLYLDLQQITEAANQRRGGPPLLQQYRDRALRALALDSFRYALLAGEPTEAGWRVRGVIATTGTRAGLPGLLTTELDQPVIAAVRDPGAELQIDVAWRSKVGRRILQGLAGDDERPGLLAGFTGGPLRLAERVLRHLVGRGSLWIGHGGERVLAAPVRDRVELEKALAALGRRRGHADGLRIENDWLVWKEPPDLVWQPPSTDATANQPFVSVRGRWPGTELRLDLQLHRRSRQLIDVELRFSR